MDLPPAAARKILDVNVLGTLAWTQRVHAAGMADRGGSIVNIASVAGVKPAPGISFYGVSKAAVMHLTAEPGGRTRPERSGSTRSRRPW